MKKIFISKVITAVLLLVAVTFTSFPATTEYASAKSNKPSHHHKDDKNKDSKDKSKAKNYLVLVGQTDGTYKAYDNIAFKTSDNAIMVKAKLIADALGLDYQSSANCYYWHKKGCVLGLGQTKNIYFRNRRTYVIYKGSSDFYNFNYETKLAQYKMMVHQNYNAVHCATISNLVNYQYYDTLNVTAYSTLGFGGVVVYNRYNTIPGLPDLKYVTNLKGNNSNNNNNNTPTVAVKPVTIIEGSNNRVKYIEAVYSIAQNNNNQLLDLAEVLTAFANYGLPSNGVYGYGNCDTAVTIQGIDKNGYNVGEIKTTGNEFLVNFPNAVKLSVIGAQKNLVIDFTPVKPTVITSSTLLPFNQVGWLYPTDGYARQYFVIPEYTTFRLQGITTSSYQSHRLIDMTNSYNPDNASSYQRITAVLTSPYTELYSPTAYVSVQKTNKVINNTLVVFSDTGNAVLAADYETKLLNMITTLSNTGLNTYFPSKNWNRQLVMKLPDNTVNTAYNYITVDASSLNLDLFYDYYLHLHEMVHFYEATQTHYGFRFTAWTDGNATRLAIKTMDNMNLAHKDANGIDYFDTMYKTDFSFLTENDKKNFEAYYLNATGWNATLIGYHFTDFLQDTYGNDIIYRIMEKVYAANIPVNNGRNSTYDKQFTDCIKAVTSPNVFQLFVDYRIN